MFYLALFLSVYAASSQYGLEGAMGAILLMFAFKSIIMSLEKVTS